MNIRKSIMALAVMHAVQSDGANNEAGGSAVAATATRKAFPFEMKEANYHFKKEKIKNEKGEKIGEGKKLPSVKASIPVPNEEGILEIVAAGEVDLAFLKDMMYDAVFSRGRQIIDDYRDKNPTAEVPADILKPELLTWDVIARLPKAERGPKIADEEFEDFFTDYREIMPKASGKDLDRIEKHVAIYKKKFQSVRNDKKALGVLSDMLAMYAANTPNMEDNEVVYDYLKKRVETLMQEEEKVLAEAL